MALQGVEERVQVYFPQAHVVGQLSKAQDKALVFDMGDVNRMLVVYHHGGDRVHGFGLLEPVPEERVSSCVERERSCLGLLSYWMSLRSHEGGYGVHLWHHGVPVNLLIASRHFPLEGARPESFVATDAYFVAGYQERLWLHRKGFVLGRCGAAPPDWSALGAAIFTGESVIGAGSTLGDAVSRFRNCFPRGQCLGELRCPGGTAKILDARSPTLCRQQRLLLFLDEANDVREIGFLLPVEPQEGAVLSALTPSRDGQPYVIRIGETQGSYRLYEDNLRGWKGREFLVESGGRNGDEQHVPCAFELWRHARAAKLMPEAIVLLY